MGEAVHCIGFYIPVKQVKKMSFIGDELITGEVTDFYHYLAVYISYGIIKGDSDIIKLKM